MTMNEGIAQQDAAAPADGDGFEWGVVEIFGHRRHAGRVREEECFGAKMLRVDVPIVVFRESETAARAPVIDGWKTHYYGGGAIFSFSLTDEESVMRANRPYEPAGRLTYRDTADDADGGEF